MLGAGTPLTGCLQKGDRGRGTSKGDPSATAQRRKVLTLPGGQRWRLYGGNSIPAGLGRVGRVQELLLPQPEYPVKQG